MSNVLRSRVPHSALMLLTVAGLASSMIACSKEEEKKAGWTCNAADVPMGEVLRCTQQAATSDGVSSTGSTSDGTTNIGTGGAGGTSSDPVNSDGTSGSGTADGSGTGGTGGTAGDGSEATGDGTSSTGTGTGGTGGSAPVGGTGDLTTNAGGSGGGIISYECFPGDTNPDCPPADAYDGMTGGASDAQTTTDVTSSIGSGTGTGGGGGTGDGSGTGGGTGGTGDGSQGTSDGTSSTGDGTGTGGGTGGTATGDTGGTGTGGTGGTGGSSGGTQGTSDGTSSTGNGNGNGGGGGNVEKTNRFPGPDECAWVPDLPYCPAGTGNSSDGSPSMGDSYGGAGSTSGGTTSSGGTGGSGGSSGDGSLPPGQDKKYGGTGDGTSSTGGTGDGTTSGGTTSGGTTSGGTTSGGTGDGTGDGTSSGGTAGSSGSSSGGTTSGGTGTNGGTTDGSSANGGKNGRHYKCEKDAAGNKSCVSVPNCVPGTNPSNGACADSGSGSEVQPPSTGGCWITGGGFIIAPNDVTGAPADGHDNYGGNAKGMKDGRIQGHWNHVDHGTKNHAKGKPEYLVCRRVDEPGPGQPGGKKGFFMNQAYFGGPAEWRDAATGQWASGYWFDVVVKDHGEPGSVPHAKNGYMVDTYHFTIRKMDDPNKQVSGAVIYEVGKGGNSASGGLVGGNIQLHPPNNGHPYTPMALPNWVSFEP